MTGYDLMNLLPYLCAKYCQLGNRADGVLVHCPGRIRLNFFGYDSNGSLCVGKHCVELYALDSKVNSFQLFCLDCTELEPLNALWSSRSDYSTRGINLALQ